MLVSAMGPVKDGAVGREKFRGFVVIDEAQKLLNSKSNTTESIAKYTSEIRKFGIGLILATQLKDSIPSAVWGNIDTRFFMGAFDKEERRKNAKAAEVEESRLQELEVGEGLFFSGSKSDKPPSKVRVKAPGPQATEST